MATKATQNTNNTSYDEDYNPARGFRGPGATGREMPGSDAIDLLERDDSSVITAERTGEDEDATDEIMPTDAAMQDKFGNLQNAFVTGFSSAAGIRNETFETLGEVRHSETKDNAKGEATPKSIAEENPGLADS